MSKIILDNKILDRLDMNVHEKYVDKNEFKNWYTLPSGREHYRLLRERGIGPYAVG